MNIISDDIGSFPLPTGVERKKIEETAYAIIAGECNQEDEKTFSQTVSDIMESKISSGLDRPNYPQIQDMIESFFKPMEEHSELGRPWVIQKNKALIPELGPLEPVARKYHNDTKKPLELRVCVTGPLELYIRKVGTQVQADLLGNLAESVSRFISNAILNKPHIKTLTVSIDEPSFGLNPNVIVDNDELIEAWNKAAKPAKNLDVQIHLHSGSQAEIAYQTDHINVLGVESAGDSKNLEGFYKKDLESYDKFLRVGVAQTNFTKIASDYLTWTGVDVWKEKDKMTDMIDKIENPSVIGKRLKKACNEFSERVKYAGPDCGMGLWPTQEIAKKLLSNTVKAIGDFNG